MQYVKVKYDWQLRMKTISVEKRQKQKGEKYEEG
jgi:hypothetical protein